jgi:superfamily II DNA or RNA helicase
MQEGCSDAVVLRLQSGVGKKRREAIRGEIDRRFEKGDKFVLLATASLIGEGYDLPRLDTLFLAMPLSFKGRVVQYAGHLHRPHAEKREVRVYDYLDEGNPLTMAMFRRRSSAYRQMGYRMVMDQAVVTVELDFR